MNIDLNKLEQFHDIFSYQLNILNVTIYNKQLVFLFFFEKLGDQLKTRFISFPTKSIEWVIDNFQHIGYENGIPIMGTKNE